MRLFEDSARKVRMRPLRQKEKLVAPRWCLSPFSPILKMNTFSLSGIIAAAVLATLLVASVIISTVSLFHRYP